MTERLDATTFDRDEFAVQIADQVESFLLALRAIAREGNGAQAVSLLLLEISQVLLAGARLGDRALQLDFTAARAPGGVPGALTDVGPEADIDELDGFGWRTSTACWTGCERCSARCSLPVRGLRPLRPGAGGGGVGCPTT